jgi:hypothetical protein
MGDTIQYMQKILIENLYSVVMAIAIFGICILERHYSSH